MAEHADREDGWSQIVGPGWHAGTEFAESERAAGIYIGDLVYLEFGVAESMDPADWARALAEVRQAMQDPSSGDK